MSEQEKLVIWTAATTAVRLIKWTCSNKVTASTPNIQTWPYRTGDGVVVYYLSISRSSEY